jgi:DNA-binding MarR family transcriptional regulator
MVSRDPDITRLLDRLERSGFIERRRGSPDRRLVFVKILEPGMQLMDALRGPVARLQERQFASLQDSDIQAFLECLARVRSRFEESTLTAGRPAHTPSFALAGAR